MPTDSSLSKSAAATAPGLPSGSTNRIQTGCPLLRSLNVASTLRLGFVIVSSTRVVRVRSSPPATAAAAAAPPNRRQANSATSSTLALLRRLLRLVSIASISHNCLAVAASHRELGLRASARRRRTHFIAPIAAAAIY
eukprot:CAMPEP_0180046930 /NCGR_PEP_ID=MMETSP0984-20121128/37485_1 /TAXON_ID=483367 /ORGANISM="non described non described, Strain CCMP 2436" /LENGTH=137 /DNA_ID=CAMNT_0021975729 /DNA_START=66 /DNA_END=477 /DNA_ORIENTATION=-